MGALRNARAISGRGGHVENIDQVWAAHHGLILPSRYEGLPLALVEAMLAGRVSIVTDVAGNRELVEDNITGFIAKGPTAAMLDEALERAWNNRHKWAQMGEAARGFALNHIPPDPIGTFANRLLAISEKNSSKSPQ